MDAYSKALKDAKKAIGQLGRGVGCGPCTRDAEHGDYLKVIERMIDARRKALNTDRLIADRRKTLNEKT